MLKLLRRLFGSATDDTPAVGTDELLRRATMRFTDREDGPKSGAVWDEGEKGQQEYDLFCERFQHSPGINFMTFLRTYGPIELERWLHPSNPSPEAKVFIRLMVEMMQAGENIWEQPGISAYADDWIRREKANPKETKAIVDAFATLAQILKTPIKLFFEDKDGKMKVWDFNP